MFKIQLNRLTGDQRSILTSTLGFQDFPVYNARQSRTEEFGHKMFHKGAKISIVFIINPWKSSAQSVADSNGSDKKKAGCMSYFFKVSLLQRSNTEYGFPYRKKKRIMKYIKFSMFYDNCEV